MFFEVRNLSVNFGGVRALSHVSLDVQKGEVHSIIGPNGAGKTTFFNVISGLIKPDSGSIIFDGEEIGHETPWGISCKGIARTFQNSQLFITMTALENVVTGMHNHTRSGVFSSALAVPKFRREEAEVLQKAERLMEFVGLKGWERYPSSSLAFGQQRLLELARALATNPKMILLDEPVAGMNYEEKQRLALLLVKIKEEMDITTLLVEHDIKWVMQVSDLISVLDYGEKIAEGNPEEIRNNERVIEAYLGKRRTLA
jgi:branched-chain amino acid transport system ATP-binding protein